MRLGQDVFWVHATTEPDKGAQFEIRTGRFFRFDGDTVAVLVKVPGAVGGEFSVVVLNNAHLFTNASDALSFATGLAVRGVEELNYTQACVLKIGGSVAFTYNQTQAVTRKAK